MYYLCHTVANDDFMYR